MPTSDMVLELVKQVATLTQQVMDLTRRVGTLEGQFWWIQCLLIGNLVAVVVGFIVANRKLSTNGNGKKIASDSR